MLLAWPTPRMPINATAAIPMRHRFASFTRAGLGQSDASRGGTEPAAEDDVLVERRQRVNLCLVEESRDDCGSQHCGREPGPPVGRPPAGDDADQR